MIFVYEPSPISVCLPAIRMKSITGAPLILWVQDLWPESLTAVKEVRSGAAMRLLERLVRWIYSRCDHVLVQSRAFTPQIAMRGVPPERISYLPNWAEEEYRPVDLEADAPHRKEMPDGFRVMFAGNIGAAQSFETIVAAADKLRTHKDIHWVILGDGRKKEWVQQEVERLGLSDHVHLLGRRPMETMPCYFSLADAMLVTLARQPIFAMTIPAKVQSYLACGRPIVAALDGEGGRIIQEAGAGLVCGSEDADGLARAVLELYQMPPDRRQAMAGRGLAYFQEHFQRDKLLDELERLMISMLER
jgi:glycosyltransferase involved in cell wall biosynthesis